MKSERRYELQTNYLADHLGTAVESSRPYAGYVILAAIAAVVAALGYGIYSSVTARAAAAGWGSYYFNIGAGDAEAFEQTAQDHAGTTAADWSKLAWADNQSMVGFEQLYTNRKTAESSIKEAIDAYEEVMAATYEPELKSRAAIALGQAHEALGQLEDATRYYKQASSSSEPGLAAMAGNRLAWISSGDGKAFYEWFATVKSTPAIPPAVPSDLSKPPTTPDITFPDKPINLPLPGDTPAATPTGGVPPVSVPPIPDPAAPANATPATTPATQAPQTPAPAVPAAEPASPAAPATPSEPASAEPTPAEPAPAEPTGEAAPTQPAPTQPAPASEPPTTPPSSPQPVE